MSDIQFSTIVLNNKKRKKPDTTNDLPEYSTPTFNADIINKIATSLSNEQQYGGLYQTGLVLTDISSGKSFNTFLSLILHQHSIGVSFTATTYENHKAFNIFRICYHQEEIQTFINLINDTIPKLRICNICNAINNIPLTHNEKCYCPECFFTLSSGYDIKQECSICHEHIIRDHFLTSCNHYFHSLCFKRLESTYDYTHNDFVRKCPICRSKIAYPNTRNMVSTVINMLNNIERRYDDREEGEYTEEETVNEEEGEIID